MAERQHKASYARDRRKGGYIIRVEGPHANRFAGREVPVVTMAGKETMELLEELLWTGTDEKSQKPVALYTFKPRPQEFDDEIPF